jgi:Protein of unknown function (DUF4239)
MSDWIFNLPVLWMGALILAGTYLVTAGIYVLVTKLAVGDRAVAFKSISPGILPPLAIIFALLVGFLAAQDWNEGERASATVNREASALRAVVLLAAAFPGEPESRLRRLVHDYIQDAVAREWPAMARQDVTLTIAPPKLAQALWLALSLTPQKDGQVAAQREMVASLQSALDARRQRIILSESSIDWVKWTVLLVQAGLTLITIAMVHSDNPTANRIILGIFGTGVGVAVLLIASHSRPFSGEMGVTPSVLLQVMPEADPGGGNS